MEISTPISESGAIRLISTPEKQPTLSDSKRSIRNIFVLPGFQFRYLVWIFASGVSLFLVQIITEHFIFEKSYRALVLVSTLSNEAKTAAFNDLDWMLWITLGVSFLFLSAILTLAILFSHRTAGPIYHFQRVIEEVRKGNGQARIHLRPKDEFQDLAHAFNEMLNELEKGRNS